MGGQLAIKWLHISDFHLKATDPFDHDLVLGALIDSLPGLINRFGVPDFVIASGDLANSGRPAEYERVTSLFDKLLTSVGLPKNRLFVVPGNHDVDRSQGVGLSRALSSSSEADAYFSPDAPKPHITNKLKAFCDWHDAYFANIRVFPTTRTYSSELVQVGTGAVEITLLNSALFCQDDNDFAKLSLGRRQVFEMVERSTKDEHALRLAVVHHPLSWLNPIEAMQVKAAIQDNFDCVLRGHLHENEAEAVAGSSGNVLHLAAGAAYQGSDWPNTALFCDVHGDRLTITPVRFTETPRPRWSLDTGLYPDAETYQATYSLHRLSSLFADIDATLAGSVESPTTRTELKSRQAVDASRAGLEERLFITPSGRPIFAEPRLHRNSQAEALSSGDTSALGLEEIIGSSDSFWIEARAQYGASTLCRALHLRFCEAGIAVAVRNARDMPNYRKKIGEELASEIKASREPFVLIIDDFDYERDDRLLRELFDSGWVSRVVVVSINRGLGENLQLDGASLPFSPQTLHLWTLDRSAIRSFASVLLDANDLVSVSRAVDKVYSDLLGLKIPLTPANVVMYLRVLQREGDFEPLSRVDILSRYLSESLRKPSDAHPDSFNFKNKMDVLSAFAFSLYKGELSAFDELTWFKFCKEYREETLSDFDAREFFHELQEARVFGRFGNMVFFRYGFYYIFFLGRYLWPRPALISQFFVSDDYLVHTDVIEVITGLSSENAEVVRNLSERLLDHTKEFAVKYVKEDFDPLLNAIWPDSNKEGEQLWTPIKAAIAAGPADVKEIDDLKTSMMAEVRSLQQQITFERFTQLENVIFTEARMLVDALKNSDDVSGPAKITALKMALQVMLIVVQVGTMFAPTLAKRNVFRWGGMTFLDFALAAEKYDEGSLEASIAVLISLVDAAALKMAQEAGSIKLAPVFRAVAEKGETTGFLELANFACVCAARGRDWAETATTIIGRTSKNAFYLRAMLEILVRTLREEVLQGRDRDATKRLVALIQVKRNWGKDAPGAKAVGKMVGKLEELSYFPEPASAGSDRR
jgi:3',5'-cyclic AMP phosphodiesterase CpdA